MFDGVFNQKPFVAIFHDREREKSLASFRSEHWPRIGEVLTIQHSKDKVDVYEVIQVFNSIRYREDETLNYGVAIVVKDYEA